MILESTTAKKLNPVWAHRPPVIGIDRLTLYSAVSAILKEGETHIISVEVMSIAEV